MRLFYLINGWAGQSVWLDNLLRFYYVGAVPLLMTALAALLIFAPRRDDGFSRRRILLAAAVSLVLCCAATFAINALQKALLGSAPFSPRPFMTHWVNVLLVEPNNNTFPSFEVMLAGATATLIWAVIPGAGVGAWCAVFVLGFARIFCGMNYFADCFAGALLGALLSTLSLAAARVPLQLPQTNRYATRLTWRLQHQTILASLCLLAMMCYGGVHLWTTPQYAGRVHAIFGATTASAAPSAQVTANAAQGGINEGEGATIADKASLMTEPGHVLLDSPVMKLDGHLPDSERYLRAQLEKAHVKHRIVGVNVAQLKAGNSAWRAAVVRFQVEWHGSVERRRVTETAAALARRAFQVDGQLQHLDIMGVVREEAPSAKPGVDIVLSETPVFTASILRRDLIIRNKPDWVNWEGLDGGLWLRARSLLYIDPKVLPAATSAPMEAPPRPIPPAAPQATPKPTSTPRAAAAKKTYRKKAYKRKRYRRRSYRSR